MTTLPDPICVVCSAPVPRRENEFAAHWRRRKTCSDECKSKSFATFERRPPPTPESKTCAACNEVFYRRKGERGDRFRDRQTCCTPCAHKLLKRNFLASIATRPEHEPRACEQCGETMHRRRDESSTRWKARRTCCNECRMLLQRAAASPAPRALKLPSAPKVMGRPTTALNRCTACGETIPKPDGMTWAKYRGRSTCGSEACKTATSRKAVGAPKEREMSPLRAELHINRPSIAQLQAYRDAGLDERRLFAWHIRVAAEAGGISR